MIWQQNTHKSNMTQSYILNTGNPNNWDIIALQEPWINSFGNSHSIQYWRVVYPANLYVEGHAQIHSIFLINTNPSTDSYSILLIMHSNVTTIWFKGENGYLSIFNIHKEITNNDTIGCLDLFYKIEML